MTPTGPTFYYLPTQLYVASYVTVQVLEIDTKSSDLVRWFFFPSTLQTVHHTTDIVPCKSNNHHERGSFINYVIKIGCCLIQAKRRCIAVFSIIKGDKLAKKCQISCLRRRTLCLFNLELFYDLPLYIPAGILHKYSDGVREPESNKKSRSPFKECCMDVGHSGHLKTKQKIKFICACLNRNKVSHHFSVCSKTQHATVSWKGKDF